MPGELRIAHFGLRFEHRVAAGGLPCTAACRLGPAWAGCAKQTQFGRGCSHWRDQMCETNPIERVSSVKFEVSSGEAGPQTPMHPIFPMFHHSTIPIPLGPRRGKRAKRTQFGPAWAVPGPGRTKDAKRTQFGRSQSCKTKPISPDRPATGAGCRGREAPAGSNYAKRS
jgi:hypothetical protein